MSAITPEKCRALLACVRGDSSGSSDRATREALQRADADPRLRESLERQQAFDRGAGSAVRELPVPEEFDAQLGASFETAQRQRVSSRQMLRNPALWAVLMALLFLVAWGGFALYQRLMGFPGDEGVSKMVTSVSTNGGNQRLEPLSTECENLADTFFLKYGLDDYGVPPGFGHYEAMGYRIFDNNSFPVAQVSVREHGLTFLIFRAEQQGVEIKADGRWKRMSGEGWSAAAQVHDGICVVVASRGDADQLDGVLRETASAASASR